MVFAKPQQVGFLELHLMEAKGTEEMGVIPLITSLAPLEDLPGRQAQVWVQS